MRKPGVKVPDCAATVKAGTLIKSTISLTISKEMLSKTKLRVKVLVRLSSVAVIVTGAFYN